jgi:hypothetical protein
MAGDGRRGGEGRGGARPAREGQPLHLKTEEEEGTPDGRGSERVAERRSSGGGG